MAVSPDTGRLRGKTGKNEVGSRTEGDTGARVTQHGLCHFSWANYWKREDYRRRHGRPCHTTWPMSSQLKVTILKEDSHKLTRVPVSTNTARLSSDAENS